MGSETPSKRPRRSSSSRDSLQLYLETSEELDTTGENMEDNDEKVVGDQEEEMNSKGSDCQKEQKVESMEESIDGKKGDDMPAETKVGENEDEHNWDISFKKAASTSQPTTIATSSPSTCVSCGSAVPPGSVTLHPQLHLPTCAPCLPRLLALEGAEVAALTCRCCGLAPGAAPYPCSSCPAGFCGRCLARVLGRPFLQLAGSPAWRCLLCDRRPLHHSRLAGRGGGRGGGRARGAATTRSPAPLSCGPPPLQHVPSPRVSPSPRLRGVQRSPVGRMSPYTSPSLRHRVAPPLHGFHPRVLFPPSPTAALAEVEDAMPRLPGVTIYRVDKVAQSRAVAREVAALGYRLTEAAAEVQDAVGEEVVEVLAKALAEAETKVQELKKNLRKE